MLHNPEWRIPVIELLMAESRSGGWEGVIRVNPKQERSRDAFATVMNAGVVPGAFGVVRMVMNPGNGSGLIAVRSWPCMVTAVAARETAFRDAAFVAVTVCDPLTSLGRRPTWTAYSGAPLDEAIGGTASAAAGGSSTPTIRPIIPGAGPISIASQTRPGIAAPAYLINAGEPFGQWLARICTHLGTRIEMVGENDGTLRAMITDQAPRHTWLNQAGSLKMGINPSAPASATIMTVHPGEATTILRARGALLDNIAHGDPTHVGPDGPIEDWIEAAKIDLSEARKRARFRLEREALAALRITMLSRQPGMIPGRIVEIDPERARNDGTDAAPGSIFGSAHWQVAESAHLLSQNRYWNLSVAEKGIAAWRPGKIAIKRTITVGGIIDDGVSERGTNIPRDREGRIPVRIVATGANTPGQATQESRQSQIVALAPSVISAGTVHGTVNAHRAGDWCRIRVDSPFNAEITGTIYRADATIEERQAKDVSSGWTMVEDERAATRAQFQPKSTVPENPEAMVDEAKGGTETDAGAEEEAA